MVVHKWDGLAKMPDQRFYHPRLIENTPLRVDIFTECSGADSFLKSNIVSTPRALAQTNLPVSGARHVPRTQPLPSMMVSVQIPVLASHSLAVRSNDPDARMFQALSTDAMASVWTLMSWIDFPVSTSRIDIAPVLSPQSKLEALKQAIAVTPPGILALTTGLGELSPPVVVVEDFEAVDVALTAAEDAGAAAADVVEPGDGAPLGSAQTCTVQSALPLTATPGAGEARHLINLECFDEVAVDMRPPVTESCKRRTPSVPPTSRV